jgi:hypothetical protein
MDVSLNHNRRYDNKTKDAVILLVHDLRANGDPMAAGETLKFGGDTDWEDG